MIIAPWLIYTFLAFTAVSMYFSYRAMRRMNRKNKIEPSQLDGSIADEGVSFSDIAGSPHLYGNIVWKGDESAEAIQVKQGKK